jgi:arsenite methyltransferase
MTTDLMFQDQIRAAVARAYAALDHGGGRAVAQHLYEAEELTRLPSEAVEWALGVGDPVGHADLEAGETVLDIGSGAGVDTILAARRVAPGGRAIGVDVLEEMCDRARRNATDANLDDMTEFRVGEMESLPLADASVDVVVSNGVLNLSPRKSRAIAEIHRVLRPGGRMCVADLTVDDDLPPEVLTSDAAWAG